MRKIIAVVGVTALLSACTDPAPPVPIAGTFALEAHFVSHGQRGFSCTSSGCVIKEDTTAIDGDAVGTVTFDTLTQSNESSAATLSLGQCAYCLINVASTGHAWRRGDSVDVRFGGVDPSLRLLGVYRGDSISGRIESAQFSDAVTHTYWGTFVVRR